MFLKKMVAAFVVACLAGCSISADKAVKPEPVSQTTGEDQMTTADRATLMIRKTATDFEVDGAGSAAEWGQAEWVNLDVLKGPSTYATKFKTLYSNKGIYFLFDCEDTKLTSTITEHYGALYSEDVVEVFLWPEESQRTYFEYELSPLNYELPILVVNANGAFMGWKPWQYEGGRKVRRGTAVRGGERESMAEVEGWSAEFFIPFELMRGLRNVPPKSGTAWRANMYRIDYDKAATEGATFWSWSPLTVTHFHLIDQFGTIVFE